MIKKLTHATVYVEDQDRAKDFYVNKLGLECRDDARMGDFRWLSVGPKTQPDVRIVLMLIGTGMNAKSPAIVEAQRTLLAAGALGGGVLETDDLQRDYEQMTAKGVEFVRPPTREPYGFAAVFKDDSGNFFSFNQED
ncbi:MAG TPA: VOC family protein [Kofleriaceae bacterium]|jgi:predicted enzyme related to lactoylglutathione lyase